jgi:hypothetical protein
VAGSARADCRRIKTPRFVTKGNLAGLAAFNIGEDNNIARLGRNNSRACSAHNIALDPRSQCPDAGR